MSRRICVLTGTRAEYGLLRWVMQEIQAAKELELQVIATGMHLSPEFGLTYREIESDGFRIDRKVEMLVSADTPTAIAKSMGLGLMGISVALAELQPDVLVVLGDRFELLSAAAAAMVARIPVAHLHGGEATEGLVDEPIRHSVTKMSHLHFVAAEEYRKRVIQLGEDPERVFLVGGLGVDGINRLELLSREELERSLGTSLCDRSLLVTFHPTTLEEGTAAGQVKELIAALDELSDVQLIFTMPNADTDGRVISESIEQFVAGHSNAQCYTSLGHLRYLSCMRHVSGVVGNSSSGLIEAPALRKGSVNIGDRQRGRLKADSVIDCEPNRRDIRRAMAQLFSPEFQSTLDSVVNPYGDGGASQRVVDVLKTVSLENILKKHFFDLPTV